VTAARLRLRRHPDALDGSLAFAARLILLMLVERPGVALGQGRKGGRDSPHRIKDRALASSSSETAANPMSFTCNEWLERSSQ
jgi:hypothetical protein